MVHQLVDDNFAKEIIFSDGAHFKHNGFTNKQNCRVWCTERRVIRKKPLHPQRAVGAIFERMGCLALYCFENKMLEMRFQWFTERRTTLIKVFCSGFIDSNHEDMWFQQDGTTCHTEDETIRFLKGQITGSLISRNAFQNWPEWSCHLIPCDFFLWIF